jgi:preprotein translocase subunit SecA
MRSAILNSINLKNEIGIYGENLMLKFSELLEKIKNENLESEFLEIRDEINFLLGVTHIFSNFNLFKKMSFEEIYFTLKEEFWITYDLKELLLETIKPNLMRVFEKRIFLSEIDKGWKLYLQKMEILKETIGWRGYAQLDPLLEYNFESSNLFVATIWEIRYNSIFEILQSLVVLDKKIQ